jgi:sugar transferase (PEP-CTERM/EpsH1 system associated)
MTATTRRAPLIAHVVANFDTGGLENGMVNLLNRIPPQQYRHAVICLSDYTDYSKRIDNPAVGFYALHKRPGKDFRLYIRLWRLLRRLRPQVVHTRNLSALEAQFVAAASGVHARIHGEHGRDVFDLEGKNRKYNVLRKLARPLVRQYICVSQDLAQWLVDTVDVPPARIKQIYNGVDMGRFRHGDKQRIGPEGFIDADSVVIGSVGRMVGVKDYANLIRAFHLLVQRVPSRASHLRLVIVGEGGERSKCQALIDELRLSDQVWLSGARADVNELMRGFDLFVLPSLGEGISNTILEAMASGLPVVATAVGGNPELVDAKETGLLVPSADSSALADALSWYVEHPDRMRAHGAAGRAAAERRFSMETMVSQYSEIYAEQVRLASAASGDAWASHSQASR